MKDLVKAFQNLPWIVKLLLVIVYNIYGGLTRIFRSFVEKNILGIILSILLLVCGWIALPIFVLDLIFVILGKEVWWFC